MSLLVNKLDFNGSDIDAISYLGNKVQRLIWNDEIVWELDVPNQQVEIDTYSSTAGQWLPNTVSGRDYNSGSGWTTYMSNYGKGVANSVARCQITIFGFTAFTLAYASWAESSFDYTCVSNTNQNWATVAINVNTSGIKVSTSGKQNSWYTATYSNLDPTQEYTIWICFRKDGSVNSSDDRGYFAVETDYIV